MGWNVTALPAEHIGSMRKGLSIYIMAQHLMVAHSNSDASGKQHNTLMLFVQYFLRQELCSAKYTRSTIEKHGARNKPCT